VRRAQVLTNLGSIFSTLGRFVEAIEYRDRALQAVPRFGMALGTRAETLLAYGERLYKKQDRLAFCAAAIDGFAHATRADARYENDYGEAVALWTKRHVELAQWLNANKSEGFENRNLGSTRGARAYCKWCLENRVFLDPLNDLGPIKAAVRDQLHLPGIAPHSSRSEMLMGYLDLMQQEFATARWSLYEAFTLEPHHFSDAALAPHDTGDGPRYGLRIERLRTAFRTAYSIFDKNWFLSQRMARYRGCAR
jgi:tetratricopeptide (TPR) repeat protein